MKSNLPLAADDGWDMSPRRESSVRVDMPTSFEPLSPERPLPSARGVLSAAEIEALLTSDMLFVVFSIIFVVQHDEQ